MDDSFVRKIMTGYLIAAKEAEYMESDLTRANKKYTDLLKNKIANGQYTIEAVAEIHQAFLDLKTKRQHHEENSAKLKSWEEKVLSLLEETKGTPIVGYFTIEGREASWSERLYTFTVEDGKVVVK